MIGNFKSFVAFGIALDRLRDAAAQGDDRGVAIFAGQALGAMTAMAAPGLLGKVLKYGVNQLKIQHTLHRLATREIDYATAKGILKDLDRFEWHHVMPRFLGGREIDNFVHMPRSLHRHLHVGLTRFPKQHRKATGQNLVPSIINPGKAIQTDFSPLTRLRVLAEFYALPQNRHLYQDVVEYFFKHHPGLGK